MRRGKKRKKPHTALQLFLALYPVKKFPKRLPARVEQALLNRRPLAASQFVAAI